MRTITAVELDRAAGALLGTACGDALGAGYEFGSAALPAPGVPATMIGGGLGGSAPGEWTDDTAMAVCVAEVAATGADLRTEAALDRVAEGFARWFAGGPPDVGVGTRGVLSAGGRTAAGLRDAAAALHDRTGRTAGNGSLMRTAAVALAHLGDDAALRDAAMAVSELTHSDPLAGEACVLWCAGIDRAVRLGTFDGVRDGLALLPAGSRDRWGAWLSEAEASPPDRFAPNGFVVPALQAAWSAVTRTPVPPDDPGRASFGCLHLQHALQAAVRAGDDTDTVAAIAGALLGARWGASAVPARWRRVLHGWPGLRAPDLVRLGVATASGRHRDRSDWPAAERLDYGGSWGMPRPVPHPHDPEVLLGPAETLAALPADVSAVVSLCRIGAAEAPARGLRPEDHVEMWLVDSADPDDNAHLEFVVDDAARTVAALRAEGHRVLLHCVAAQSRTPTVAARYAVLRDGLTPTAALADLLAALPLAGPNPRLRTALLTLGAGAAAPAETAP